MEKLTIEATKPTCHKCGHTWVCTSKADKVSCPMCGSKVKIERDSAKTGV